VDDLIVCLRDELYPTPYEEINWSAHRDTISDADVYYPTTSLMNVLNKVLVVYEKLPNSWIRSRALKAALDQIRYEDENTDFLDIGPVNKVMNMLAIWVADGPDSETFRKHVERIPDFMWMSSEGMMMNGTNGSQLWDTSFAILAIMDGNLAKEKEFEPLILKSLEFFEDCQIQRNHPKWKQGYRHQTKGAWPFSTKDQGYTVSDCTAEGLKSVLSIQKSPMYVLLT
jgi:lanosterol synthase